MDVGALLTELFGRIPEEMRAAVEGLSADDLAWRPADGANSIGWLVWHLTRVEDDHVAELLDEEPVWVTGPWAERFGLDAGALDTGYGHSADEVGRIRPESATTVLDYYDAVSARTKSFLATLGGDDLDRVVDTRWDPPVTLGVRLVSVADDAIQHAGQAGYVRGLLGR